MKIKKFSCENFRNIKNTEIEFSDGVNLLFGDNAEGKTNAVEGIYIFARGKSFRPCDESDLTKFGEDGFSLKILYEEEKEEKTLEYRKYGKERRRIKNGYKISKIKEFIGSFKAVLFSPDDLSLVKASPEERRIFLNIAISQVNPSYIDYYSSYKKALEQRNCILKCCAKGFYYDEKELFAWSDYMAKSASYIYVLRRDYIKKLELYAKEIMLDISEKKENIEFIYKADIKNKEAERADIESEYREIFKRDILREGAAGVSIFGPHRDDIEIKINGSSARSYASQGQQRSVVLSMKLAEGEICRELSGEYPVFLFDDVLSELDSKRKKYILEGKKEKQIIISSCEYDENASFADRIIRVKHGEYEILK